METHVGNTFEAKAVEVGDLFTATEGGPLKAVVVGRQPGDPAVAVLVRGEITPSYDVTGRVRLVWAVYAIDAVTGEVIATWGGPTAVQAQWFDALREHK